MVDNNTKSNCKVTVCGGDVAKRRVCSGLLTEAESGFSLLYSIDGDECFLAYDGRTLTQRRGGSFKTEMTFLQGEKTECVFCEGEFCGTLPVICERLNVICGKSGVNIKIKYSCGGQKMALELTAAKITEKK